MSAPKFTPGSWVAPVGSEAARDMEVAGISISQRLDKQPSLEAAQANAALIAAAPDLFAALEQLCPDDPPTDMGSTESTRLVCLVGELRRARAALAKARGGVAALPGGSSVIALIADRPQTSACRGCGRDAGTLASRGHRTCCPVAARDAQREMGGEPLLALVKPEGA